jgi:hypothetical protein
MGGYSSPWNYNSTSGGTGGMMGLGQLLQMLSSQFRGGQFGGGQFGGMNAPNAAGAAPAPVNPWDNVMGGRGFQQRGGGFNQRGGGFQPRGSGLAPSVLGAPQVGDPAAYGGGGGETPAAAGGTVPMGNLLQVTPGQMQGRARSRQVSYGGGLARRTQPNSWAGPQGARSFGITAQ